MIVHNSARNKNRINHYRIQLSDEREIYLANWFMSLIKINMQIICACFRGDKNLYLIGGPHILVPLIPVYKKIGFHVTFDTYDWPLHKDRLNKIEKKLLWLYGKFIAYSDVVLFLNQQYKNTFVRLSEYSFDDEKTSVMLLPPIPAPSMNQGNRLNERLEVRRLVYIGHFAKVHAIEVLLSWFEELQNEADCFFDLIGQDKFGRLQELRCKYQNEKIKFHGHLKDVSKYIKTGNIGIGIFGDAQKSVDSETNKILEYMENGMLVITGRNYALPYLFPQARGIFYVKSMEDLSRTLQKISFLSDSEIIGLGLENKMLIHDLRRIYPKKAS